MKKTVITCVCIAAIFAALAGLNYVKEQSSSKSKKEQTGQIIEPAKAKTGDDVVILGRTPSGAEYIRDDQKISYQEVGDQEEITYQVRSVELTEEFSDEDGYYEKRGKLEEAREDYRQSTLNKLMFEEEFRYLRVRVSVENKGTGEKILKKNTYNLFNVREDNMIAQSSGVDDFRCVDSDGKDVKTAGDYAVLAAGEKAEMEMVFLIEPANVYHLYLRIDEKDVSTQTGIFLDLNLYEKETDGDLFVTEREESSVLESRDLATLKLRNLTNKDIAESLKQGTEVAEVYFHEKGDTIETKNGDNGEIFDTRMCTVTAVSVADRYDDIPASFAGRNYLKDMTQIYCEKYGYQASELKYLFLTVELEQKQNTEEYYQEILPASFWIYRREGNRVYVVGYPDDYEIISEGETAGQHKDYYRDHQNEKHTFTVAYILWPEVMDNLYLWSPGSNSPLLEGSQSFYSMDMGETADGGVKIN